MLTTPAIVTAAEYLAAERKSPERHEFFNGKIIPVRDASLLSQNNMGGASFSHNTISSNLVILLGYALWNKDYLVHQSDMRVHDPSSGSYFYPDVVITAGKPAFGDDQFDNLLNPALVVKVLSAGTESYDRGDKALAYRQIPSLREYLLVSQDKAVVEHWVRLEENKWQVEEINGLDATLRLLDGTCEIKLADVYRKVLPKQ
jgi:Uma2 family endonuclease